jgi:TRAP-type C4-dicarboxylate transport system permease small subunit
MHDRNVTGEEVRVEMVTPGQGTLPDGKKWAGKDLADRLERGITLASKFLLWVAGAGLVSMLLLVVGDVVGIKFFHSPVPGGTELVEFLSVVAIAFAVPYTQVVRGHVAVDFIFDKLPRRARLMIDVVTGVCSAAVFAALTVYGFKYGVQLQGSGEVSGTQGIPFYPFVYGMALCFAITLLVLMGDLAKSVAKAVKTWTR